ncbi:MAG TPA: hypothetical protein VGN18_03300 [Jatrophihabitans sp.]|jgi:hypothetical protein|uniref:hypothetical protein n=1 Tax=Jatrophihabitans sp. TaxID=1932789 RepID=UPI002DF86EC0|nr:hypothetical protein [Jatrophihabitans sp.]
MTHDATAEARKLAHTLGVGPERLSMLDGVPGADLRTLRKQIGEALFQADKPHFARVAALSKAVPTALAAKLTEAVLPPLLAARTAELIEPGRAVEMVTRVSERYLADVAAAMDASRAPAVVGAIPPERVARIGRELADRKEWVVIGGFVVEVGEAALRASVAVFSGEELLRVGFVLDDMSRLDDIGAMLSEAQIDELLAAAAEHGLWVELADLLENLAPPRIARMAERFAAAGDELAAAYAAAVEQGALAPESLARLRPA